MKKDTARIPLLAVALLCLLALISAVRTNAQEARPFEDVKPDHWAYQAVTDLLNKSIITGYPEAHFSGQRTLTRYEFAVALKRAFDRPAVRDSHNAKSPETSTLSVPTITPVQVDELRRLTALFKNELISLSVDMKEVQARLADFARAAENAEVRREPGPHYGGQFLLGARSVGSRYGFPGLGGVSVSSRPMLLADAVPNGFESRSRFGSGGLRVFGGVLGDNGSGSFASGLNPGVAAPSMQTARSLSVDGRGYPTGRFGLNADLGGGYGGPLFGSAPMQVVGLQGVGPLPKVGEFGVTVLGFSAAGDGALSPGVSPSGAVYGANLRLNPFGHFAVSGEAARSVASSGFGDIDDSNAFLLNMAYSTGPVTGAAGYQYLDPNYIGPTPVNRIGGWNSPSNVQGPFARAGYRFSDAVNAKVGVDYLTAARNRPGFGGFTTGSNLFRALGGVNYHFSKQFALSADYEGVFYDLSGAISGSGLRAKPVEQYITLGAGLNLTGNTVLRLAYQIINVQDAGTGFGLSSSSGANSPGGASSTSVITTQFSVHF